MGHSRREGVGAELEQALCVALGKRAAGRLVGRFDVHRLGHARGLVYVVYTVIGGMVAALLRAVGMGSELALEAGAWWPMIVAGAMALVFIDMVLRRFWQWLRRTPERAVSR